MALRLIFCENYLTVKSFIPAIVLYFPLTPHPLSRPHHHPLSVPQKQEEKKVRKKERKKKRFETEENKACRELVRETFCKNFIKYFDNRTSWILRPYFFFFNFMNAAYGISTLTWWKNCFSNHQGSQSRVDNTCYCVRRCVE